jgi:uncharacterized protein (DUF1015 family)
MQIYPLKAFLPISSKIENPCSFIDSIKDNFNRQVGNGIYADSDIPSYYIYSINLQNKVSYGLVSLASAETIEDGTLVPHEATIEKKKDILLKAILEDKVVAKPIMVFIDDDNLLSNALKDAISMKEPIVKIDLSKEGIHEIYRINNHEHIFNLEQHLLHQENCFVADGHHRLDTLQYIFENSDKNVKILLSIFSKNDLTISGYHRILPQRSIKEFNEILDFLNSFGQTIYLDEFRLPDDTDEIVISFQNKHYSFTFYSNNTQLTELKYPSEKIENIFNLKKLVLLPYHVIENKESRSSSKDDVVIYIYPISFDTLISETKKGNLLPPKSTWFEPKVRSGLIVGKVFG